MGALAQADLGRARNGVLGCKLGRPPPPPLWSASTKDNHRWRIPLARARLIVPDCGSDQPRYQPLHARRARLHPPRVLQTFQQLSRAMIGTALNIGRYVLNRLFPTEAESRAQREGFLGYYRQSACPYPLGILARHGGGVGIAPGTSISLDRAFAATPMPRWLLPRRARFCRLRWPS